MLMFRHICYGQADSPQVSLRYSGKENSSICTPVKTSEIKREQFNSSCAIDHDW